MTMKTLREYIDLLESIEQGVSEGKKLDRLARKFVPGAASRQITDKVKDELATHLIAKDAGEDGDAELNKKDMRQTARNIDRYNKFAREKGVAETDNDKVNKDWRSEVGTDYETTKNIVDPSQRKIGKAEPYHKSRDELNRKLQGEPDAALEETQQVEEDPVAQVERLAREIQGR